MDILGQFGINSYLLIAQIVNFVILLLILKRFLYRPILRVLETRKQKIAQSLENAQNIEKRLLDIEQSKDRQIQKAIQEGGKIISDAKIAAGEIIKKAHLKASIDLENIIKEGKNVIKQERETMQQQIKEQLSEIVVSSLEKIIKDLIPEKQQKEIIEKSIKVL